MFTGLVEAVGTVTAIAEHGAQSQLTIANPGWGGDLEFGESIAVNGVCLTVAKHTGDDANLCVDHCVRTLERQLSDHHKLVKNRKHP